MANQNLAYVISVNDAQLRLATAHVAAFNAELARSTVTGRGVDEQFRSVGRRASQVGNFFTRNVTVPIALAGVASAKLAADFQTSLAKIQGVTNTTAADTQRLGKAMLDLGKHTIITNFSDLADAAFELQSVGFKTNQTIKALGPIARTSAAGLGSIRDVADTVASALDAYGIAGQDAGKHTLTANQAVAVLIGTVNAGKLRTDELARSIGRIIPLANAMSISFDQVGGGIAALSRQGLSANLAVTGLRALFSQIARAQPTTQKAFAAIGTSTGAVQEALGNPKVGLLSTALALRQEFNKLGKVKVDFKTLTAGAGGSSEALLKIKAAVGQGNEALSHAFPNIRALTAFLILTGPRGLKQGATIFSQIKADIENSQATVKRAYGAKLQTDIGRFQLALTKIRTEAILVGPTFIRAGTKILEGLQGIADFIQSLKPIQPFLKAIGIGLLVFGPLVALFGRATQAASFGVFVWGKWQEAAKRAALAANGIVIAEDEALIAQRKATFEFLDGTEKMIAASKEMTAAVRETAAGVTSIGTAAAGIRGQLAAGTAGTAVFGKVSGGTSKADSAKGGAGLGASAVAARIAKEKSRIDAQFKELERTRNEAVGAAGALAIAQNRGAVNLSLSSTRPRGAEAAARNLIAAQTAVRKSTEAIPPAVLRANETIAATSLQAQAATSKLAAAENELLAAEERQSKFLISARAAGVETAQANVASLTEEVTARQAAVVAAEEQLAVQRQLAAESISSRARVSQLLATVPTGGRLVGESRRKQARGVFGTELGSRRTLADVNAAKSASKNASGSMVRDAELVTTKWQTAAVGMKQAASAAFGFIGFIFAADVATKIITSSHNTKVHFVEDMVDIRKAGVGTFAAIGLAATLGIGKLATLGKASGTLGKDASGAAALVAGLKKFEFGAISTKTKIALLIASVLGLQATGVPLERTFNAVGIGMVASFGAARLAALGVAPAFGPWGIGIAAAVTAIVLGTDQAREALGKVKDDLGDLFTERNKSRSFGHLFKDLFGPDSTHGLLGKAIFGDDGPDKVKKQIKKATSVDDDLFKQLTHGLPDKVVKAANELRNAGHEYAAEQLIAKTRTNAQVEDVKRAVAFLHSHHLDQFANIINPISKQIKEAKHQFDDLLNSIGDSVLNAFDSHTSRLLDNFDAQTQKLEDKLKVTVKLPKLHETFTVDVNGKTPAERELEALDKLQAKRSAQRDLFDARKGLQQAFLIGDPAQIRDEQRKLEDAQTEEKRNGLETRAKKEREAADKALDTGRKQLDERRATLRRNLEADRAVEHDTLEAALKAEEKMFQNGKIKLKQYRTDVEKIMHDHGVTLGQLGHDAGHAYASQMRGFFDKLQVAVEVDSKKIIHSVEKVKDKLKAVGGFLGILNKGLKPGIIGPGPAFQTGVAFPSPDQKAITAASKVRTAGARDAKTGLPTRPALLDALSADPAYLADVPARGRPTESEYKAFLKKLNPTTRDKVRRTLKREGFTRAAMGIVVPGSGTGDTVPAMLTPGEIVLNAGQQRNLQAMLGYGQMSPDRLFARIARFGDGGVVDRLKHLLGGAGRGVEQGTIAGAKRVASSAEFVGHQVANVGRFFDKLSHRNNLEWQAQYLAKYLRSRGFSDEESWDYAHSAVLDQDLNKSSKTWAARSGIANMLRGEKFHHRFADGGVVPRKRKQRRINGVLYDVREDGFLVPADQASATTAGRTQGRDLTPAGTPAQLAAARKIRKSQDEYARIFNPFTRANLGFEANVADQTFTGGLASDLAHRRFGHAGVDAAFLLPITRLLRPLRAVGRAATAGRAGRRDFAGLESRREFNLSREQRGHPHTDAEYREYKREMGASRRDLAGDALHNIFGRLLHDQRGSVSLARFGAGPEKPYVVSASEAEHLPRYGKYLYHGTNKADANKIVLSRNLKATMAESGDALGKPAGAFFSTDPLDAAFHGNSLVVVPKKLVARNLRKVAFGRYISDTDVHLGRTAKAAQRSSALRRNAATIATEFEPHAGLYPEEHAAYQKLSWVGKARFARDSREAVWPHLTDIAERLGLELEGAYTGKGFWRGLINPGLGIRVRIPKTGYTPEYAHRLETFTAAVGQSLKQGSVPFGHPVSLTAEGSDIFEGQLYKLLKNKQGKINPAKLQTRLDKLSKGAVAVQHSPQSGAYYLVNYGLPHEQFHGVLNTLGIKGGTPIKWQGSFVHNAKLKSYGDEGINTFQGALKTGGASLRTRMTDAQAQARLGQLNDNYTDLLTRLIPEVSGRAKHKGRYSKAEYREADVAFEKIIKANPRNKAVQKWSGLLDERGRLQSILNQRGEASLFGGESPELPYIGGKEVLGRKVKAAREAVTQAQLPYRFPFDPNAAAIQFRKEIKDGKLKLPKELARNAVVPFKTLYQRAVTEGGFKFGHDWYDRHALVQEFIARHEHVPSSVATRLGPIYSPQATPTRELGHTIEALRAWKAGHEIPELGVTMQHGQTKANEVLRTSGLAKPPAREATKTQKTWSYASETIRRLAPGLWRYLYDARDTAVVDSRGFRDLLPKAFFAKKGSAPNKSEYLALEKAFQVFAEHLGWSTSEGQGSHWIAHKTASLEAGEMVGIKKNLTHEGYEKLAADAGESAFRSVYGEKAYKELLREMRRRHLGKGLFPGYARGGVVGGFQHGGVVSGPEAVRRAGVRDALSHLGTRQRESRFGRWLDGWLAGGTRSAVAELARSLDPRTREGRLGLASMWLVRGQPLGRDEALAQGDFFAAAEAVNVHDSVFSRIAPSAQRRSGRNLVGEAAHKSMVLRPGERQGQTVYGLPGGRPARESIEQLWMDGDILAAAEGMSPGLVQSFSVLGGVQRWLNSLGGEGRARGGVIGGSGQGDIVPALLTPGEIVLNAGQQRNLSGMLGLANAGPHGLFERIASRFADGGVVDEKRFKQAQEHRTELARVGITPRFFATHTDKEVSQKVDNREHPFRGQTHVNPAFGRFISGTIGSKGILGAFADLAHSLDPRTRAGALGLLSMFVPGPRGLKLQGPAAEAALRSATRNSLADNPSFKLMSMKEKERAITDAMNEKGPFVYSFAHRADFRGRNRWAVEERGGRFFLTRMHGGGQKRSDLDVESLFAGGPGRPADRPSALPGRAHSITRDEFLNRRRQIIEANRQRETEVTALEDFIGRPFYQLQGELSRGDLAAVRRAALDQLHPARTREKIAGLSRGAGERIAAEASGFLSFMDIAHAKQAHPVSDLFAPDFGVAFPSLEKAVASHQAIKPAQSFVRTVNEMVSRRNYQLAEQMLRSRIESNEKSDEFPGSWGPKVGPILKRKLAEVEAKERDAIRAFHTAKPKASKAATKPGPKLSPADEALLDKLTAGRGEQIANEAESFLEFFRIAQLTKSKYLPPIEHIAARLGIDLPSLFPGKALSGRAADLLRRNSDVGGELNHVLIHAGENVRTRLDNRRGVVLPSRGIPLKPGQLAVRFEDDTTGQYSILRRRDLLRANDPIRGAVQDFFGKSGRFDEAKLEREMKKLFKNRNASGGAITGSGLGDIVPSLLTPGEIVLNAGQQHNLSSMLGLGKLSPHDLFDRIANRFAGGGVAQRFAGGGVSTTTNTGDLSFVIAALAKAIGALSGKVEKLTPKKTKEVPLDQILKSIAQGSAASTKSAIPPDLRPGHAPDQHSLPQLKGFGDEANKLVEILGKNAVASEALLKNKNSQLDALFLGAGTTSDQGILGKIEKEKKLDLLKKFSPVDVIAKVNNNPAFANFSREKKLALEAKLSGLQAHPFQTGLATSTSTGATLGGKVTKLPAPTVLPANLRGGFTINGGIHVTVTGGGSRAENEHTGQTVAAVVRRELQNRNSRNTSHRRSNFGGASLR